MTGKIKALGLALVAVLALGAVAASAARATTHEVEITKESAEITGTQENGEGIENYLELEGSGAKWECTEAHFKGQVENGDTSITAHPEYEGCYAPGLSNEHGSVTVGTEGCNLVLDGETVGEHARIHIECEEGHEIMIAAPGCTIYIPEQTPESGVHYINMTTAHEGEGSQTPMEVTIGATVTGIRYTATGALCFLVEGDGEDADLYSSITAKAYEAGQPHDVEHQIGFTVSQSEVPHSNVLHEVEIPEPTADITATQENGEGIENYLEIESSGAKWECTEAHYSGTVENGDTSITLTPTITGCYAPGLSPEHGSIAVNTENCHFTLTGKTDANGHGGVHIGNCPEGEEIRIEAPGCTISFGNQTPQGGVRYTNRTTNPNNPPMEVTIDATLTGIEYETEGALCFLVAGNGEDAKFVSSITAKAYEDGSNHEAADQIDLTVNPG